MRFGLIGYGAWGKYHARAIAGIDGLELVAIACGNAGSAAEAARDFPAASVTTDWRSLVADPRVEAVDIVTPNHLHAANGCAALRAGKHVLLEKPMAIDLEGCDALLAAQRESGKVLTIGHELRRSSQWGKAKALIDDGTIGSPLFININLFRNFYRTGADGWRYDRARVGSWMLEEAVHFFDLVGWYFARVGDPVSIRACGTRRPGRDPHLFDMLSATMRFPAGAYATITQCTAGFENHLVVEIAGTDGAIRSQWSGTMDRDHNPVYDFRVQARGFPFERGVRESEHLAVAKSGEVYELADQIRLSAEGFRRGEALVSGEDARKAVRLCLAAERSAVEDREISLLP